MKKIVVSLSHNSIQNAIKELQSYQADLETKLAILTEKLAELGITVGQANLGQFSRFIRFSKQTHNVTNGYETIMVMYNIDYLISQWWKNGHIVSAEVNPVLMAEFGSGIYADDARGNQFGAGKGTFPGQTHVDEGVWHWTTLDGVTHVSSGEKPNAPLLKAMQEMQTQIYQIAKEVFS